MKMKSRIRNILLSLLAVLTAGAGATAPESAWAAQNPARWAFETSDEGIRFFTAVAVLTYWECARDGDPVKCQTFVRSLEDPNTHIGFAVFAAAAQGTGKLTQWLSRERFSGKYLGMAAGMLASELYGEFAANPHVREFLTEKRAQRRKELFNKIMGESLGNKEWWEDKLPTFAGLVGGSGLSATFLPAVGAGLKTADVLVRMTPLGSSSAISYRVRLAREGLALLKQTLRGTGGARVHPALLTATALAQTIVFVKGAEAIQHPVTKWWGESRSAGKLSKKLSRFENQVAALSSGADSAALEAAILGVEAAWDKFRASQFLTATRLQGEYIGEAGEFERQLTELYLHYSWIASGAKKDSPLLSKFNPGDYRNRVEKLTGFFCGVEPRKAVQRALTLRGVPIPGRSHDRVIPFRVAQEKNTCSWLPNLDPIELLAGHDDREYRKFGETWTRLIRRTDYTAAVDRAFAEVFRDAARVREDMIQRYNTRLAGAIEGGLLTGTDSRMKHERDLTSGNHVFRRGIIPSYLQETGYWKEMQRRYPKADEVFDRALQRTKVKRQAAQHLLAYVQKAPSASAAFGTDEEIELGLGDSSPDWEKVVANWKSFVLQPL